ncbi:sodium:proton antiporter [Pseudaeromonas paramecii]|uniref:Cation:proton antiporter n=1 Tax=Pseudaeromonas paramecii TaxID=2138166 RepID=A0ABP8QK79_9GAMM
MTHNYPVLLVLFGIVGLLLGALVRRSLRHSPLPYSVALLLMGLLIGLASRYWGDPQAALTQGLDQLTRIEPHLLLFLFLPTLIFESAFAMETHLFRRLANQIALLAIPVLVVAVLLTALLLRWLLPWEWSWPLCLLFGALISATDPVAVVALLKEVSSRKRLETLIDGESLLNDGTAIVLFSLFLAMLTGQAQMDLVDGSLEFAWVVLMGGATGLLVGGLALWWIERIYNDPLVEISISIVCAYLAYFLAEHLLHVSGVVAVVILALLFAGPGRTRISVEVAQFLHHFWEISAYIANTLIFLLVGLIIALRISEGMLAWWWVLGLLYLGVFVIRGAAIALFMPLLGKVGMPINRQKAMVLTWGGLRGAVSLALALTVANQPGLPAEVGDQVLFLAAGIVLLSIAINGTSMGSLLAHLGLNRLPPAKQATVASARRRIAEQLSRQMADLQADPLMARADWRQVSHSLALEEAPPRESLSESSPQDNRELAVAYQRRILEAERRYYWLLFREGALERHAVRHLTEAVEHALDGEPCIGPRVELYRLWGTPPLLRLMGALGLQGQARWLNRWLLSLSFGRMALGYEVARGFIQAQEEMSSTAEALSPSDALTQEVQARIALNKQEAIAMIRQLQESFPEVAYSLETQTARRVMLNKERYLIEQLEAEAKLESSEAQKLVRDVESRLAGLRHMPRFDTPTDFRPILKQAPWLAGVRESSLQALSHCVRRRIHAQGEQLLHGGAPAEALVVLGRGHLRCAGQPVQAPGSTLGLEALLTGHYGETLYAEGPCDLLWLPLSQVRSIAARDPVLARNISDAIAAQLAPQPAPG